MAHHKRTAAMVDLQNHKQVGREMILIKGSKRDETQKTRPAQHEMTFPNFPLLPAFAKKVLIPISSSSDSKMNVRTVLIRDSFPCFLFRQKWFVNPMLAKMVYLDVPVSRTSGSSWSVNVLNGECKFQIWEREDRYFSERKNSTEPILLESSIPTQALEVPG